MSLFDFLKGNKKRRRTGGRSAKSDGRRADEYTSHMPLPPSSSVRPNPGDVTPIATPRDQTMLRRDAPAPAPPTPVPEAPRPAPVRIDSPAPALEDADSGQTLYHPISDPSAVGVVGVLVAIDGDLRGQIFGIGDGENQLGRGSHCQVELNSQKISRSHAMLIHQDGMFVIKPLSDKNPTFLNDSPTEGDELGDGDTIRLGSTTLKFRSI